MNIQNFSETLQVTDSFIPRFQRLDFPLMCIFRNRIGKQLQHCSHLEMHVQFWTDDPWAVQCHSWITGWSWSLLNDNSKSSKILTSPLLSLKQLAGHFYIFRELKILKKKLNFFPRFRSVSCLLTVRNANLWRCLKVYLTFRFQL